jgi:purine-cytosine permease-like protein
VTDSIQAGAGDARRDVDQHPDLVLSYADDPEAMREAMRDDFSLHVVPPSWRLSKLRLLMAWSALYTAMFWIVTAAILCVAVGSRDAIIGVVLASVVAGIVNGIMVRDAIRSGTTVALASRPLFGHLGSTLVSLVYGLTTIWYAVFEGSIIAFALNYYFPSISLTMAYGIVSVVGVLLVVGGVRIWLDKLNAVLLPFYVVGLVGSIIWALAVHGYDNTWLTYTPVVDAIPGPGWWFAFTTYLGVWILMMMSWDFARLGKVEDTKFHSTVTFGPVFMLMTLTVNGLIGIFLMNTVLDEGTALSEVSAMQAIVNLMGVWGLIWVTLTQIKINTANFYLAGVNFQSFVGRLTGLKLPRVAYSAVAGVAVFLVMQTNVFLWALSALQWQSIIIVAWVAIMLAHVALKEPIDVRPRRLRPVTPGVVAWLLASGLGVALMEAGSGVAVTFAAPLAFVSAGLSYVALKKFAPVNWFVEPRSEDLSKDLAHLPEARVRCSGCGRSYLAVEMDRDTRRALAPICASCA